MCTTGKRGGANFEHFAPNELVLKNRYRLRDYTQSAKQIAEMNHFPTREENLFAKRGNSQGEGVTLGVGVSLWRTTGI